MPTGNEVVAMVMYPGMTALDFVLRRNFPRERELPPVRRKTNWLSFSNG
jgi:hypothetical protein